MHSSFCAKVFVDSSKHSPQSQLAAGPCDPNARRILAGKPPASDNPSIKTQRLRNRSKAGLAGCNDPKFFAEGSVLSKHGDSEARHVLMAPSSICADASCASEVLDRSRGRGRRGELAGSRGATWTALTPVPSMQGPMI